MSTRSATDPLLARALEVAADLKAKYDACGQLPKGIDLFFQDVCTLDERRKQQRQHAAKKKKGGKGEPRQQQKHDETPSSTTLARYDLRSLKRQRAAIEQEQEQEPEPEPAATTTTPLHPAPTPEVVILRFIELPKLLVVRIVHMLEFHELASLDTTCTKFHPFAPVAPVGLTQLSAEMRAQWVLKPWQVKAKEAPRPVQAWSRWLAEDVRWRERVVRAGGGDRVSSGGDADHEGQHTLVVSKEGVVMSCGYSFDVYDDGEEKKCPNLGHGKEAFSQRTLKVVAAMEGKTAVQVSAGGHHSLVLAEGGDVFSFGEGRLGQLGHGDGDEEDQHLPKMVETLKGKRAVQVSAGQRHNLVLTESGEVFSFGHGYYGALGQGKTKTLDLPKLVEALKGKKVVQVSAGGWHSLVLAEGGDVFSFGAGGDHQLGHGEEDEEGQRLPKLVEALKGKKVVQVSAGGHFSLVLTESGEVFSFGQGYDGQLGHGDNEDQDLPKLVEALKGKKVVQVSAGNMHSLVLTECGDVFSFGEGADGRLGHGDETDRTVPKLVEALKGKHVVEIQAGVTRSLVRMKDDSVFVFGKDFQVLDLAKSTAEDDLLWRETTYLKPHRIHSSE